MTNYGSMEPLARMAALVIEFISTLDLDKTDEKNWLRQVVQQFIYNFVVFFFLNFTNLL